MITEISHYVEISHACEVLFISVEGKVSASPAGAAAEGAADGRRTPVLV